MNMKANTPKGYVTVYQAAKLCGVHFQTINNWMRKGVLPYEQVMKNSPKFILKSDLPSFLVKKVKKGEAGVSQLIYKGLPVILRDDMPENQVYFKKRSAKFLVKKGKNENQF